MIEKIKEIAHRINPEVIEWRRWLHRHPELSQEEYGTMAFVADRLREMGLEPKTGIGRTGCMALLRGGIDPDGYCVALRSDYDALPLQEATGLPFASENPGVLWLILQSVHSDNGVESTQPMGVVFCVSNCAIFALYLGTCRPLIARYSSITLMKWMFLISFLVSIPFTLPHLPGTDFSAVPVKVWWEIGFLIFFATFIAYFLIPIGQQRIRPTLVSMYGYLQPIIAIGVAIATGMDSLTLTKVLAAALVFVGVYVVNQSRAAKTT